MDVNRLKWLNSNFSTIVLDKIKCTFYVLVKIQVARYIKFLARDTHLFYQAISKYTEEKDLAERVKYVADRGGRVDVYTVHL